MKINLSLSIFNRLSTTIVEFLVRVLVSLKNNVHRKTKLERERECYDIFSLDSPFILYLHKSRTL